MRFISCAGKVVNRVSTCIDIAILASPLIIGAAFYGTVVATEIGLKSVKTVLWGKDE